MKGWKNIVFAILLGLTSIFSNADMQAWIAEHVPAVGGSLAFIIGILRYFTNSAIFKK